MRDMLHGILYGSSIDIRKGQTVVFRRMRRKEGVVYPSSEQDLVLSPAINPETQVADTVYPNQWSDSERYMFDDYLVTTYRTNLFSILDREKTLEVGLLQDTTSVFFFEHWLMPTRYDIILLPIFDKDGVIENPVRIKERYDISMTEPLRADTGRIEFWRCITNKNLSSMIEITPEST